MTIADLIPDVEAFLALEPEELGAKLLFLIRKRLSFDGDMFWPANFENELWDLQSSLSPQRTYPRQRRAPVALAFSEAWA